MINKVMPDWRAQVARSVQPKTSSTLLAISSAAGFSRGFLAAAAAAMGVAACEKVPTFELTWR